MGLKVSNVGRSPRPCKSSWSENLSMDKAAIDKCVHGETKSDESNDKTEIRYGGQDSTI